MAKWRLADSLRKLRDQINTASPRRNKESDGSIGDAAHATRDSDHNPWVKAADGVGVVTAIDVTHDPTNGVDGNALSKSVIADSRVKYVIWNGRIWKKRTGQWEAYRGINPHKHHVHISVQPTGYDNAEDWPLSVGSPDASPARPTLKRGDKGREVARLQSRLGIEADGNFGLGTENAVKRFQEQHGLTVDGKVSVRTWEALG